MMMLAKTHKRVENLNKCVYNNHHKIVLQIGIVTSIGWLGASDMLLFIILILILILVLDSFFLVYCGGLGHTYNIV